MAHPSSNSDEMGVGGKQVANLCENCHENKLEMEPLPHEYLGERHVKLFGWVIMVYRNKSHPIDNLCGECLLDRSQANERDRLDPALNDAYNKGWEDAQREGFTF